MWAQLIKSRVKPENEEKIRQVQQDILQRARQQQTGWLRSITLQNQADPQEYYTLVMFESEEAARTREQSPEQQEMVSRMQALMDGRPEFVNLNVVEEMSP